MDWRVLGPVEVRDDEGEAIPLGGPKQLAVLALLLINPDRAVETDVLVEELWPDGSPTAGRKSVQAYVARLKKALETAGDDGPIRSTPTGYTFTTGALETDAHSFERLFDRARSMVEDRPEGALAMLREALALWRGRPFENVHMTPALELEAARLAELRLVALEDLAESEIRAGHADAAVPELRALVETHPFRERMWSRLMLALYQSGRQTEALRAAAELRTLLRDQLGVDPTREVLELEQAILEQDPKLDPPRRRRLGTGMAQRDRRRVLGGWLPVAVAGIAVLVAVGVVSMVRDEDGPRVSARYLLPPGSTEVAAGDRLWVLVPESSELVSIDPDTGASTHHAVAHRPSSIAVGLGSVWVASEVSGRVGRFHSATGQLLDETEALDLAGADLAVGVDAVWIIRERRRALLRIDPRTMTHTEVEVTSDIPPVLPDVAVDGNLLWATNSDIGRVLWLDLAGGDFGFAGDPRLGTHASRSITASHGSVWFSQPTNGTVTRVDGASREVTAVVEVGEPSGSGFPLLREPYAMTYGPGGLWVALPEEGRVVVLDEVTGEVTSRLSFGEPASVVALSGAVWVLDRRLEQLVRIDPRACDELPFIGAGADLRGCDLTQTVLLGVDLSDADVRWATVGSTLMTASNLSRTDFFGTDLRLARLDGVTWKSTRCPDGSMSDAHGGTCLGHLTP